MSETENGFTEYRLSPAALKHLDAFWDYTLRILVCRQAETYIRAMAADIVPAGP